MTNLPANLDEAARAFARAASSPQTLRAYRSDMQAFNDWSQARGLTAITSGTVAAFLADQANAGLSAATISRRAAALAYFAKAAGLPNPVDDRVKAVLAGIRRTLGTAPKPKLPLSAADIRAMVDTCDGDGDGDEDGRRDKALILLGFSAALRRSELAALDIENLRTHQQGMLITLERSKTDQEGQGQTIAVVRAKDFRYCVVWALREYISARTSGPLFVHGNRFYFAARRLSSHQIAIIVKRRAAMAGLDPTNISGHSLRSGFVTSACESGAGLLQVTQVTRHKNLQSVKRYFHGDLFENHAGRNLL